MTDAIRDRMAKPGTFTFGLRYAPSGYSDAEIAAWSGGYWAARRDRPCPYRDSDPRADAWWRGRAAGQGHA